MMFDREELQALRLGARMVRSWADPGLSEAAANALRKIEAVLPADLDDPGEALYAPSFRPDLDVTTEAFALEPGRTLEDFLERIGRGGRTATSL